MRIFANSSYSEWELRNVAVFGMRLVCRRSQIPRFADFYLRLGADIYLLMSVRSSVLSGVLFAWAIGIYRTPVSILCSIYFISGTWVLLGFLDNGVIRSFRFVDIGIGIIF